MDYIGIGLATPKNPNYDYKTDGPIVPLYMISFEDYFSVVSLTQDTIEVRTGKKRTARLPRKDFDFITWEEFLRDEIEHIYVYAESNGRFYFEKDAKGKYEDFSGIELEEYWDQRGHLFVVTKLEGNWAQVELRHISDDEPSPGTLVGTYWVVWRNEGGHLLIHPQ